MWASTLAFTNFAFAVDRWQLDNAGGITWKVATDTRLPHDDHIEMSGRRISIIVHYGISPDRRLEYKRDLYWPSLRTDRANVRGYLHFEPALSDEPVLRLNDSVLPRGPVRQIRFDGILTISFEPQRGISVTRNIFPAPRAPAVIERWTVRNGQQQPVRLSVDTISDEHTVSTIEGPALVRVRLSSHPSIQLAPGATWSFAVITEAATSGQPTVKAEEAEVSRRALNSQWSHLLVLETPDPVLDRAFRLAKIRTSESIFDSKLGPIHSPGGGRFYAGIWANDQAEYAGPFFPFLGYPLGDQASLNAYLAFGRFVNPDFQPLPSSLEVEGDVVMRKLGDRGDAAMIAYGASRFALALGDRSVAETLWPEIAWCLEYCRRKTTSEGVVASDTDEMEGRLPTGRANLSTSTLAYGGLISAAALARSLDRPQTAGTYLARAAQLRAAIEQYFGATVEGFQTYRYYAGSTHLRDWICLPLTMGILDRAGGTAKALLTRLWTPNGLISQSGDTQFWDRTTLYALRGLFQAGATEQALDHLTAFTHERLLGEHVPYAIESHPEGEQAHLSAESALYCRVYIEGLFGIEPTGLASFRAIPRLPAHWNHMQLRRVFAFGQVFDLQVERTQSGSIRLTVNTARNRVFSKIAPAGQAMDINFETPSLVSDR